MEPRRVDERDLGIRPIHDADERVPRGLGPRRDDRQIFTEGGVQERRFADVRAADDCDGSESHGDWRIRRAKKRGWAPARSPGTGAASLSNRAVHYHVSALRDSDSSRRGSAK